VDSIYDNEEGAFTFNLMTGGKACAVKPPIGDGGDTPK
jgi:hypothetical protein